jgi:hypothetical protein
LGCFRGLIVGLFFTAAFGGFSANALQNSSNRDDQKHTFCARALVKLKKLTLDRWEKKIPLQCEISELQGIEEKFLAAKEPTLEEYRFYLEQKLALLVRSQLTLPFWTSESKLAFIRFLPNYPGPYAALLENAADQLRRELKRVSERTF